MTEDTGLVAGYLLDGEGGGRELGWTDIETWNPDQGPLWLHLHRDADRAVHWLREESRLDPLSVDALLAEETRPRCLSVSPDDTLRVAGTPLGLLTFEASVLERPLADTQPPALRRATVVANWSSLLFPAWGLPTLCFVLWRLLRGSKVPRNLKSQSG